MSDILEIGADGSFDISSEPVVKPAVSTKDNVAVKTEKKTPAQGQLEIILSQLAVSSYKIVENKTKSSFLVLFKLPVEDTVSNMHCDSEGEASVIEVFVSSDPNKEERKYVIPVPKTVTGLNGQRQYVVVNKNNIECHLQKMEECTNVVINVPYSKA